MTHPRRYLPIVLAALALGACVQQREVPLRDPSELSTPRATMEYFLEAARGGEYGAAALALDLRGSGYSRWEARRVARQLQFVLDSEMWVEPEEISDLPAGEPEDGENVEVLGELSTKDRKVPMVLVRQRDGTWLISDAVVEATPALYAEHGRGWLADQLPEGFSSARVLGVEAWQWIGLAVALVLAFLAGWLVAWLLRKLAMHVAHGRKALRYVVEALTGPGRILLTLAALTFEVLVLRLAVPARQTVLGGIVIAFIVTLSWLGLRLVGYLARLMDERLEETTTDPLRTRGAKTQVMVLRRAVGFVVVMAGISAVLMQFNALQRVGASVLASAGVIGIVVGIAAQRSISTLIAGIQLSLTQPIRVGDHIIVEGEWGTVEDITLSYVVVKTWDLRRLVVPITYFLDHPFQNWTRTYTGLLGTVFVYADYRLPVDRVRQALFAFLHGRPEWDGDVANVQVTSVSERSMELRVIVSAADSAQVWDLRCAVREHLVAFLQGHEGGRYLPRARVAPMDGEPPPQRNGAGPFADRARPPL